MIILIILIILVLLSFNLFRNLFKNDATILDDVKLKESEPSNNGFALMLEQDDGTYEESSSSSWPTDMKFNSELSGCIDINGNIIENALEYDSINNIMNVSVGETAYCYVYFDMDKSLNNKVVNSSDIWDMTAEVGIDVMDVQEYRYVGTNPSNYICFGTSDKNACINDTDKYMYRIIGVFEDSDDGSMHAKLIKKEALNTTYRWNTSSSNVDWNESDLYKGLNGIDGGYYTNLFVNNDTYDYMIENSIWYNTIATWDYAMTNTKTGENNGPDYYTITTEQMYLHELNRSSKTSNIGEWKTVSTKISLMYASDYTLSLGSVALNYTSNSNKSTMKTGWMHISKNDKGTPSSDEWTMSHYGEDDGDIVVWIVFKNGYISYYDIDRLLAVRPVFYLTSDAEISGGTGTSSNPFLLKVN